MCERALLLNQTSCRLLANITDMFPAVAYRGGVQTTPPPKFRSFDKVELDCKLSGECLVFLFQHRN